MDDELKPVDESKPPENKYVKESVYDRIPLNKKQLNVIIAILIVAIIVMLTLGVLVGNDII